MAATPGIKNGSNLTIYIADVDGTEAVANHVTDLSVSVSTDTRDTTTKNNGGYRALLPGLKNLTVNFTAFYADDATTGYDHLMTAFIDGTKQDVQINPVTWANGTPTVVTDDGDISFSAYITSLELSAGTEDNASYTCTLECVSTITWNGPA